MAARSFRHPACGSGLYQSKWQPAMVCVTSPLALPPSAITTVRMPLTSIQQECAFVLQRAWHRHTDCHCISLLVHELEFRRVHAGVLPRRGVLTAKGTRQRRARRAVAALDRICHGAAAEFKMSSLTNRWEVSRHPLFHTCLKLFGLPNSHTLSNSRPNGSAEPQEAIADSPGNPPNGHAIAIAETKISPPVLLKPRLFPCRHPGLNAHRASHIVYPRPKTGRLAPSDRASYNTDMNTLLRRRAIDQHTWAAEGTGSRCRRMARPPLPPNKTDSARASEMRTHTSPIP